jgi:hypothetical protein
MTVKYFMVVLGFIAAWGIIETPLSARADPLAQAAVLEQSHMETAKVLDWAQKTAMGIMSFGYENWDAHLKSARSFFTPHGWTGFELWLKDSRTLDWIQQSQVTMTPSAMDAPKLVQEGPIGPRYIWMTKFSLRVDTKMDGKKGQPHRMDLTLLIARVEPSPEAPEGLAIEQWIETN